MRRRPPTTPILCVNHSLSWRYPTIDGGISVIVPFGKLRTRKDAPRYVSNNPLAIFIAIDSELSDLQRNVKIVSHFCSVRPLVPNPIIELRKSAKIPFSGIGTVADRDGLGCFFLLRLRGMTRSCQGEKTEKDKRSCVHCFDLTRNARSPTWAAEFCQV